jgi:hypothetical protein
MDNSKMRHKVNGSRELPSFRAGRRGGVNSVIWWRIATALQLVFALGIGATALPAFAACGVGGPNPVTGSQTFTGNCNLTGPIYINGPGGVLTNTYNIGETNTIEIYGGTTPSGSGGSLVNNGNLSLSNSAALNIYSGTGGGGNANVTNAGSLANAGAINNAGYFNVNSSGSVTGTGTYSQTAGTAQIDGSLNQGSVNISGGLLNGTGTVGSPNTIVIGSGATIAPGSASSPGALTMTGNVGLNGQLSILLNSATSFSNLSITGLLSLGSSAQTQFMLGFTPTSAQYTFEFVETGGAITGFNPTAFNIVGDIDGYSAKLTDVCSGGACGLELALNENGITAPIPEPSTYAMLLSGLVLLGFVLRPNKQSASALAA